MTLPYAIGTIEGFFAKGTSPNRPQRNRNPGNINFAPWLAAKYGATKEDGPNGRFAVFKTVEDGWSALHDLLSSGAYASLTIEEAINKYAPPSDNNDSVNYVEFVCDKVGCKPTDIVRAVLANG